MTGIFSQLEMYGASDQKDKELMYSLMIPSLMKLIRIFLRNAEKTLTKVSVGQQEKVLYAMSL